MIKWNGGKCPVARFSDVEVRLRDGRTGTGSAWYYAWEHSGRDGDVVAYRVVPATEPTPDFAACRVAEAGAPLNACEPAPTRPTSAPEFLDAAAEHMRDRAARYDKPTGERSVPAVVAAFNAATGHALTAEQGWMFLALVKMVRSQQGLYCPDNYEDLAAYAALMGEQAEADRSVR